MISHVPDLTIWPPLRLIEVVMPVTVPPPHCVGAKDATVTLGGKASVIETCVRSAFASIFLIVIVSVLVCPTHIVLGLNLLLKEGGCTVLTCRVALAPFPSGEILVIGIVPVGSVDINVPSGMLLI